MSKPVRMHMYTRNAIRNSVTNPFPHRGSVDGSCQCPMSKATTAPSCVRKQSPLRDEAVADARFGEQVARARGVHLELAAEVRHVDAQVVAVLDMRRSPDLAQQVAMREH